MVFGVLYSIHCTQRQVVWSPVKMRFTLKVNHATATATESDPRVVAWATGPDVAPTCASAAAAIHPREDTVVDLDVPGITAGHTRLVIAVFTHITSDYHEPVLQPAGSTFVALDALPAAVKFHVQGQIITDDGEELPVSGGLNQRGTVHVSREDGETVPVTPPEDDAVLTHLMHERAWAGGVRNLASAELADTEGPKPIVPVLSEVTIPSWNAAGITIPGAAAILFRSVSLPGGTLSPTCRTAAWELTCRRYGVTPPTDPTSRAAAELAAAACTMAATFCAYCSDFVVDPATGKFAAADRFAPVSDLYVGDCEDLASNVAAVAADWGAAANDVPGKALSYYIPAMVSCIVGSSRAPGGDEDDTDGLCSHGTCILFARDALETDGTLPTAYASRLSVPSTLPRMLHVEATNIVTPLPSPDAMGYGGTPSVREYREPKARALDAIYGAFPPGAPKPVTLQAPYVDSRGDPVEEPSFFNTYARAVVVPPTSRGAVNPAVACGTAPDGFLVLEWDLLTSLSASRYGVHAGDAARASTFALKPSTRLTTDEAQALARDIRLGQAPRLQCVVPSEWRPAAGMAPIVPSPHGMLHHEMLEVADDASRRLEAASNPDATGVTTVWIQNASALKGHPGIVDAWERIVQERRMGVVCETHVLAQGMVQWVVQITE